MKPETNFAKPERSDADDIGQNTRLLREESSFLDILGAISGITSILDDNRQIIYANESFLKLIGIDDLDPILGKRTGEAIGCIHAGEMYSGCGTAEACAHCGAINSILECQRTGMRSTRESRITTGRDGKNVYWDLKVTTSPVSLRNKTFYVFSVEDISSEKRRENLERIFFHDILNSAGNLNGLLNLLKAGTDPDEERELIELSEESSRELIDEILLHRQLTAAEKGQLTVNREEISPAEILRATASKISRNEIAAGKKILITGNAGETVISSDRVLLQQVLFNMLKNALEATESDGAISAGIELLQGWVRFTIHNDLVMPDSVRLQVFQRSFSTKGHGRGVGTYSIKLLTESYLGGNTGFSSTQDDGTKFWIDLPVKSKDLIN